MRTVLFIALSLLCAAAEARHGRGGTSTSGGSGGTYVQIFSYPSGFASAGGTVRTANEASFNGSVLAMTPLGTGHQAGGGWYTTQVNVQTFTTTFTFNLSPAVTTAGTGAALAFVVQNSTAITNPTFGSFGTNATADANVGGFGSYNPSLGASQQPIGQSVAVKFDTTGDGENIYPTGGTPNGTGVYIWGGAYSIMLQENDLNPYGILLGNSDTMSCTITYDGSILVMVLVDTVTGAQARYEWPVNVTAATASNTAYVGFSGGTPPGSSFQTGVLTWTYGSGYNARLSQPVMSPAAGQYAGTQSVTMTVPSGATCYYTTNGLLPTTASTQYTGAFNVTSTKIVKTVCVESGFTDSLTLATEYQIGNAFYVNLGSGFSTGDGMIVVGSAVRSGSTIQLTDTASNLGEGGGAWWSNPVPISSNWSTTFQMHLTSASANGLAFVLQNYSTPTPLYNSSAGGQIVSGGPFAISQNASAGGYSYLGGVGTGTTGGIASSVALFFDLFNSPNSVGMYTDGAIPTGNQTTITGGINLTSGHPFNCTVSYNAGTTTLTLAMTDTVNSDTFNKSWTVDVAATVGASTAYPGFTASTGGQTANMFINNWTFLRPQFLPDVPGRLGIHSGRVENDAYFTELLKDAI